jgi:hypothetical protein
MKNIWLIQRLEKPVKVDHPFFGKDNPFAFGGGMKNGGLSKEAMDILREVFSFDYMGSAEFEWGAVPKALTILAEGRKNLVKFELQPKEWGVKTDKPIFVICNKNDKKDVSSFIEKIAKDDYAVQLKEYTRLNDALLPPKHPEWPCRIFGWLELETGFFFFTDKEMYDKTCQIFEVK